VKEQAQKHAGTEARSERLNSLTRVRPNPAQSPVRPMSGRQVYAGTHAGSGSSSLRASVPPCLRASPRAFSMVEMLIALMVSTMLLSACLVALDSSFKSYETTTESASTHVVSRLVMHRVMAMVRQGEEFGPYPMGVLIPTKIESPYIEFVSHEDEATGERQVTRLEKVADPNLAGSFLLEYKQWNYVNSVLVNSFTYPLIRNVRDAKFTLEYDIGPVLTRATVDLTINPNNAGTSATSITTDLEAPVLRLISSASPRKID
jgi:prepilin-type N-terminal cleavage/methylation domain-containing protein